MNRSLRDGNREEMMSLIAVTALYLCATLQQPRTTKSNESIEKPPSELSFGGFYQKCVYFHGLPIIGSEKVSDQAFRVILVTFDKLLAKVPDAAIQELVKAHSHYSIIAATEGQTDLPEYWDLKSDPKTDWNKRARGLGGRNTSGGEENILELPSDRYRGESIYIHEFAHTLASVVFRRTDPNFRSDLTDVYTKAIAEGLWQKTYSASNKDEYWAEGVQMYFDCARSASPANGVHNEVCNREQLKSYDPRLFNLVDREFGGNPWRYDGTYCTTKTGVSLHR